MNERAMDSIAGWIFRSYPKEIDHCPSASKDFIAPILGSDPIIG
jgi:hypothetical protein